ncbi:GH92 family glycosyl hydrolase [Sanyastnella coralliicola]|uniref:GH92 family glycosyl hydrolase n=1 Tax=Sanyastnella coralliicola TaxID=3069118 RepID=UPI0027B980CA|nr:GH92 family glycosyl hydrolase [Longitalea sp. SCSIO 12813]
MRYLLLLVLCATLWSCSTSSSLENKPLCEWVDPFIGTGGHGHTYPGATRPFGMVQLSPDSRLTGWDGCGGYHFTDSIIYGFSHTHLQGTGISDYGDILIMPTNNEVHTGNNWGERYRSSFRKETERAHAGYYSVHLDDHNVTAELTATERVGIHRYIYDQPDSSVLFIDMQHRDELISYQFEPMGDSMIVGLRQSKEWAQNQLVYFAMKFDKPFEYLDQTYELYQAYDSTLGEYVEVTEYVPVFPLKFGVVDTLNVKVALAVSGIDAAIENLNTEAPHWNFDEYLASAESAWNNELKAIEIETSNAEDKTIFYTSLYHSLTVPNAFDDVNGNFRSTDGNAYTTDGHRHYTVFSLWDTFRATHPLYTIIQRERTSDFIHTFLDMYQKGGELPMWELGGNYTGCMIGYHAIPVITDAYKKGITDFDAELALEAMVAEATMDELGKREYESQAFLSSEIEHESVSKTLEYAYNDWCIADFARSLNGNDDPIVKRFSRRALNYRNLYDPETGFIRPKRGGSFIPGFDPREVNFNYTEANGWQYNFFTPQDVNGHIELMGGDEAFGQKLDSLFYSSSQLMGRNQADITGLIGQYAHGNEPSHHMAYLYPYIGQAWKTQTLVDSIMSHLYHAKPNGLSGNEDCGQMSSWYVLSAMGFYPVTPGSDIYVFGTPRFDEASINLENGNTFKIVANGDADDIFIQSVTLNGVDHTRAYIKHDDIMKGGVLEFNMGSTPNKSFGQGQSDRPYQKVRNDRFFPTPIIRAPRTFKDETEITIDIAADESLIYYRFLAPDTTDWLAYKHPLKVTESCIIETYSESGRRHSKPVRSEIKKIDHDYKVFVKSAYDNQYHAGGDQALMDGITGGPNFKTGEWQGYYGKDVEVWIDLGSVQSVSKVSIGALQDVKPWIWLPPAVEFYAANDTATFNLFDTVSHDIAVDDYEVQTHDFVSTKGAEARWIKVVAKNYGLIPPWHLGVGNPSWLFLDEIEIELAE